MSVKHLVCNVAAIIALLIGNIAHADPGRHIEVRISDLAANPDKYVNEKLSIVGLVDDVCPAAGCWASIKDPEAKDVVRFKVPDGKLVFTAEMLGGRLKPIAINLCIFAIELKAKVMITIESIVIIELK